MWLLWMFFFSYEIKIMIWIKKNAFLYLYLFETFLHSFINNYTFVADYFLVLFHW